MANTNKTLTHIHRHAHSNTVSLSHTHSSTQLSEARSLLTLALIFFVRLNRCNKFFPSPPSLLLLLLLLLLLQLRLFLCLPSLLHFFCWLLVFGGGEVDPKTIFYFRFSMISILRFSIFYCYFWCASGFLLFPYVFIISRWCCSCAATLIQFSPHIRPVLALFVLFIKFFPYFASQLENVRPA